MKPVTTVLLAGLLVSGCVHRHVTVVESSPEPEVYGEEEVYDDSGYVYEEECEPVWDGHAFIVVESHIHGGGCGHWYHHGCWHLFPEYHVYSEFGYSWCGDTGGFFYAGDPCARVWDGLVFLFLRGHVHGSGCGHYYHHGCWNTCERDYVYADPGHCHFSSSPPRTRTVVSASRVGGGNGEARRSVGSPATRRSAPQGTETSRQQAQPKRAGQAQRVGQPQQGKQPQRIEQPPRRQDPPKREQPQRIEQPPRRQDPPKREQPQRIEQPPRRQDPPKREQPQRIEQPPKRQDPPKREQPQRIEQPPRRQDPPKREQPQRIEQPPKRQDPPKREAPQRQDAPKKRDPEKKDSGKRK